MKKLNPRVNEILRLLAAWDGQSSDHLYSAIESELELAEEKAFNDARHELDSHGYVIYFYDDFRDYKRQMNKE